MQLNSILSGISAWHSLRPVERSAGFPSSPPLDAEAGAARSAVHGDVFEQGQWWKNRAVAKSHQGEGLSTNCSCGSCCGCGARAYATTAAMQPGAMGASQHSGLARGEKTEAGAGVADITIPGSEKESSGEVSAEAARDAGFAAAAQQLSREEKLEIARLKHTETRVRAHEMAHLAVAGSYARGGASFSYTTGPDGKRYITGGEVSIDTSKEPSPEATIRKMRTVRAAAMAPVDPSPQDRRVAAMADAQLTEAMRELEAIRNQEQEEAAARTANVAAGSQSDESQPDAHRPGSGANPAVSQFTATVASYANPTSNAPRIHLVA